MLDTVPYPTGQRRSRKRTLGPVQIEELEEMLNRPTVTCQECGTTYWAGFAHVICTRRPKEEYL